MKSPTAADAALTEWLGRRQGAMLKLLEEIVNIDSNSYDKRGVDRVGDVLRDFLGKSGVDVAIIPLSDHGDTLS